ncbi:hypothetical protein [Algibacter sp. Ld11]
MKNKSPNYLTNSRVGRRWSIDTLDNKENEISTSSIISSNEGTQQDPNY